MAVISDRCPGIQVTVVDINQERINVMIDADSSKVHVYELGLDAVVGCGLDRNPNFSRSLDAASCLSV